MSLDIKVKKKKLVVPSKVQQPTTPIPFVPKVMPELPKKSEPALVTNKSKKYGFGWWILFVVLVLLFIGVIYIIWNEQKNNNNLSVGKKNNAGIVSTFTPENDIVEDNQVTDQTSEFSLTAIDMVVTEFTNQLFLFKQKTSTSTTDNTNLDSTGVYANAQLTFTTLQEQYQLLQQNFNQKPSTTSTIMYANEIEDNIQRIQGEFNIVATLIDLNDDASFLNEIIASFEKLDQYFQEINNLTNIIYNEINPDLTIVDSISTSTVQMTTTTDAQATSTSIP